VRTLSSRKKGLPWVRADQERCEQCEARIVPQQCLEELVGAGGGQRVEPELRIGGLAAPSVLVLRAVVDQE
jgi:hypothetical protein